MSGTALQWRGTVLDRAMDAQSNGLSATLSCGQQAWDSVLFLSSALLVSGIGMSPRTWIVMIATAVSTPTNDDGTARPAITAPKSRNTPMTVNPSGLRSRDTIR